MADKGHLHEPRGSTRWSPSGATYEVSVSSVHIDLEEPAAGSEGKERRSLDRGMWPGNGRGVCVYKDTGTEEECMEREMVLW
jgi:hypothetical protein